MWLCGLHYGALHVWACPALCEFLLSFWRFGRLAWGAEVGGGAAWSLCLSCVCLLAMHAFTTWSVSLFLFLLVSGVGCDLCLWLFLVFSVYLLSTLTKEIINYQIDCTPRPRLLPRTEPPHDKTNKMACAPSEDSDQPRHLPSLIRVFAVRMMKHWVLSYPLSAQRRLTGLGGCQG